MHLNEISYEPTNVFKKDLSWSTNKAEQEEIIYEYGTKIINVIEEKCQPFVTELRSNPNKKEPNILWRGVASRGNEFQAPARNLGLAFTKRVRKDRQPVDTSEINTAQMNRIIKTAGRKANRTNAIFCTSTKHIAKHYGTLYAVFPIGNFKYTWSPELYDWFDDLIETPSLPFMINHSKGNSRWSFNDEDYVSFNLGWFKGKPHYEKWLQEKNKLTQEIERTKSEIRKNVSLLSNEGLPTKVKAKLEIAIQNGLDYIEDCQQDLSIVDNNKKRFVSYSNDGEYFSKKQEREDLKYWASKVKGDDGSLNNAISQGKEIMISARSILYIDESLAGYITNRLLDLPAQSELQKTRSYINDTI